MDIFAYYLWVYYTHSLLQAISSIQNINSNLYRKNKPQYNLESIIDTSNFIINRASKFDLNPFSYLIFHRAHLYEVPVTLIDKAALLEFCRRHDLYRHDDAYRILEEGSENVLTLLNDFLATCDFTNPKMSLTSQLIGFEDLIKW